MLQAMAFLVCDITLSGAFTIELFVNVFAHSNDNFLPFTSVTIHTCIPATIKHGYRYRTHCFGNAHLQHHCDNVRLDQMKTPQFRSYPTCKLSVRICTCFTVYKCAD